MFNDCLDSDISKENVFLEFFTPANGITIYENFCRTHFPNMLEEAYREQDYFESFGAQAFVSEKERQNIRYRQAAGIKEAHARNVKFGRKQLELPDNFEEVAKLYLADKIKAKDAVSMLNMKRSSFYKQINLFRNK